MNLAEKSTSLKKRYQINYSLWELFKKYCSIGLLLLSSVRLSECDVNTFSDEIVRKIIVEVTYIKFVEQSYW